MSWPSDSKGRVSAGTNVSHSAHHFTRQVAHETILVERHSASAKGKRLRCIGTGHRPVSPSTRVVERTVSLASRDTIPAIISPGIRLYRCVDQGAGALHSRTQATHQLVRTAGSINRGSVAPVSPQRENSSVHD